MADNAELNAGSGGITLALDDISGVHHQKVKIEFGDDDSATQVSAANPLPVTGPLTDTELRATAVPVSGAVTVSGVATAANQLADGHNVTVDNAAGAAAVNIQDGGNVISVDDGGATLSIDDGGGIITVDGTITEANSAAVKTAVEAIQGGQLADGHNVTVDNVGGVEVVQPTAADLNVTEASAASLLTEAQKIDDVHGTTGAAHPSKGVLVQGSNGTNAYNLKTNTTGHLQIQVLGASGDVWAVADLGSGIKTGVVSLADEGGALIGGVNPLDVNLVGTMLVEGGIVHDNPDGSTRPVKIGGRARTAEPAAVADNDRVNAYYDEKGYQHTKIHNGADIEVVQPTAADFNCTEANSGAIKTAVETIDNAISGNEILIAGGATQANDVKVTLDSEAVVLGAGSAAVGKLAANSGVDIGDVDVTSLSDSVDGPGAPSIDSYATDDINLAANTANQSIIAAPGASKQIWIYGLIGTADAAGSISIQDEDDAALSGVMPVAANGGFVMNPSGNFAMPWIKAATNKAVEIDTVTCTFDGTVTYAIVSV